eukprot:GFUD01035043.1.p1 GENE.GFUD01035043.1~~GFUD01035043.1.p1  ORF type:complete len:191 (-),score=49.38 GFUD01035043.1:74-646(-)
MAEHASTVDTYNHSCPAEGTLPTMSQLQQGMGVSGTAWLYVSSVLVCSVNCAMFLILVRKFIREVPERQVPNLCWVTSLFTAISFFTCLMIFLPRSTEFLLAAYRVYEAMVIGRFVELNLMWYGGEKQLVNNVGENAFMRFNLPPCCCCLLCLRNKLLTRKRVKHVRFYNPMISTMGHCHQLILTPMSSL